jgi:hypothetical protein
MKVGGNVIGDRLFGDLVSVIPRLLETLDCECADFALRSRFINQSRGMPFYVASCFQPPLHLRPNHGSAPKRHS